MSEKSKDRSLTRKERIDLLEKRLNKYPEMLSRNDVLEILGISKRRLNDLVENGEIKPLKWEEQKHKTFSKIDIMSFLLTNTNKGGKSDA